MKPASMLNHDTISMDTSMQVQAAIGAKNAVAFDLTAACSGFVLGLVTAAQYIRTGMAKHVLVIGADAMSRVVDWRDRSKPPTSASLHTCAVQQSRSLWQFQLRVVPPSSCKCWLYSIPAAWLIGVVLQAAHWHSSQAGPWRSICSKSIVWLSLSWLQFPLSCVPMCIFMPCCLK